MQKDLEIFVQLVNDLLEDEKLNPVVAPIPVEKLYDEIDIGITKTDIEYT